MGPVGNGILEAGSFIEAARCRDTQEVAIDQGDAQAEFVRRLHLLNNQDAAGGIGIIIQRRGKCFTASRQDNQVIVGNGDCIGVSFHHVNANDAQHGRRAI